MYSLITTKRFDKDLKKTSKRGKDLSKIRAIMLTLAAGQPLPEKNQEHNLVGNYAQRRECHIEPDWLLIYKIDEDNNEIIFECTGTHSDIF